jgi:hypothetical protein
VSGSCRLGKTTITHRYADSYPSFLTFLTLAVLAVSAQEDTAACINLGRPLLTNCASEIAALAAAGYPLTSESAPEDQGSDLEVSEGCCTSLGPFIENSCQCNTGE